MLLQFARKLNDQPSSVRQADIDALLAAGFSQRNAFDAVVIVAYFNFMNRIADGLGVAPEDEKVDSQQRHLSEVLQSRRPDQDAG